MTTEIRRKMSYIERTKAKIEKRRHFGKVHYHGDLLGKNQENWVRGVRLASAKTPNQ